MRPRRLMGPMTPMTPMTRNDTYSCTPPRVRTREGGSIGNTCHEVSLVSSGAGSASLPSVLLDRLAGDLRRLSPHHRDPERFHLDKHTIAAELHELAAALRKESR